MSCSAWLVVLGKEEVACRVRHGSFDILCNVHACVIVHSFYLFSVAHLASVTKAFEMPPGRRGGAWLASVVGRHCRVALQAPALAPRCTRAPVKSEGIHTKGYIASHRSRVRTIKTVLEKHGHSPFPLTNKKLEDLTLHFKGLKYRSISNFLSAARREHVLENHSWTPLLELTQAECRRAGKRRIGPPARSLAFRWHTIEDAVPSHCARRWPCRLTWHPRARGSCSGARK